MQARQRLTGSRFGQLMLKNLHAFHALQGLTLRRRGALVTYATSISNADAKAGMKLAAEWARRFFETQPAAPAAQLPGAQAPVPGEGVELPFGGPGAPGGTRRPEGQDDDPGAGRPGIAAPVPHPARLPPGGARRQPPVPATPPAHAPDLP